MSNRDLLAYNQRGALCALLAIEEHLQHEPEGVPNSWCARKHSLSLLGHHLPEAVSHAARVDPSLAPAYRAAMAEAEAVLGRTAATGEAPGIRDVAVLRNRLRVLFGDPTLRGPACSVCSKDRSMSGLGETEVRLACVAGPRMSWPWFMAGAAAAVVMFVIRRSR